MPDMKCYGGSAPYKKMRSAVKILGASFALCGAFFLSVFPFTLGNAIRTSDSGAILASCILAVFGFGLIFTGRYYFQSNPGADDTPRPVSKLTHFLAAHRRNLKVLAQAGFVVSLIRLVLACFGSDWPAPRATTFLLLGSFALFYCGEKASNPAVTDNRDWMRVPTWIRSVLETAQNVVGILILGSAFLGLWAQLDRSAGGVSHFVGRMALDAMIMFIFAHTALFFAFGELQPPTAGKASPSDEAEPL